MEPGIIITTLVILALIFAPFIGMYIRSRAKRNTKIVQLKDFAISHNSKIGTYEYCKNFVIGIDEDTKNLFFIKTIKDEISEQAIDLKNIQSCKITNSSRSAKTAGGSSTVVERIELNFYPKNKNDKEIILELYNHNSGLQLSGEFQIAETYLEKINRLIS